MSCHVGMTFKLFSRKFRSEADTKVCSVFSISGVRTIENNCITEIILILTKYIHVILLRSFLINVFLCPYYIYFITFQYVYPHQKPEETEGGRSGVELPSEHSQAGDHSVSPSTGFEECSPGESSKWHWLVYPFHWLIGHMAAY